MVHSCRRKQRIFRCWWIVCIEQQVVSVYYMSPTHIWAWFDIIFIASFWCQKFWYKRKTVLEDNPTVTLSIQFHSIPFITIGSRVYRIINSYNQIPSRDIARFVRLSYNIWRNKFTTIWHRILVGIPSVLKLFA